MGKVNEMVLTLPSLPLKVTLYHVICFKLLHAKILPADAVCKNEMKV